MKLPIHNRTDKPLTLFFEPYCDEYTIPPAAHAMICVDGGLLEQVDFHDGWLTIWPRNCETVIVEVISEEEQSIVDSLNFACIWLNRLAGMEAADLIRTSINAFEVEDGYLKARAEVFEAFHSGFSTKDAETTPNDDVLPAWTGQASLDTPYRAGGVAAYANHLARSDNSWRDSSWPGPGLGPLDADGIRSAFDRAAAVILAKRREAP